LDVSEWVLTPAYWLALFACGIGWYALGAAESFAILSGGLALLGETGARLMPLIFGRAASFEFGPERFFFAAVAVIVGLGRLPLYAVMVWAGWRISARMRGEKGPRR
jgi:hypothetical protein